MRLKWLNHELAANKGIGPGFHFLRHILSLIILIHHCRVAVFGVNILTPGYVKGAPIGTQLASHLFPGLLLIEAVRPGLFALVGLFFALSGFLVFGSAMRTQNIKVFFSNRILRLLPALAVEITLSALILGPLVTALPLHDYFNDSEFFRYFRNIIGEVQFVLPGVFAHNPWPDIVNANLWTLPPELGCYALMLLILITGLVGQKRLFGILVVIIFIVVQLAEIFVPGMIPVRADTTHFASWFIVFLFLAGAAVFANADLIPMHPLLFIAAGIFYWLLMLMGVWQTLAGVFLVYCMVFVGMMNFNWFDRSLKMDLSYGIYLYGFPITQAVIFFMQPLLPIQNPMVKFMVILPIVIGLTIFFAAASWKLIEKPALSLRRHFIKTPGMN